MGTLSGLGIFPFSSFRPLALVCAVITVLSKGPSVDQDHVWNRAVDG
jgi:hypothetical protein